jgi:hypothetical protein
MGSGTNETALAIRPSSMTAPMSPDSPEFERTATYMAREFSEATADIVAAVQMLHAATKRLDDAFRVDSDHDWSRFGMDLEFRRHRCSDADEVVKVMEREAWGVLVDKLGIKNVMSVKRRKEFDEQLQRGELPPVCERTITAILLGLAGQARDFARDAAKEVFDILRPRGHWGGQYATNNAFRVGRRVILPNRVESAYRSGGFRCTYHYQQEITAIDGIFHLLDGKGIMKEHRGPLIQAIEACEGGRGETEYFRFKCFKNRNLHIEFKNLELVKELNLLAAGERVLGADVE